MASEHLHAPRERLSKKTISMHQAIASLMEELEAVDWYRQRADDCDDKALKEILLHNNAYASLGLPGRNSGKRDPNDRR